MTEAKIKVVRTIEIVGHPCKACDWDRAPIVLEGVVTDAGIQWPVVCGYRPMYCPHCGGKLPIKWGKEAT